MPPSAQNELLELLQDLNTHSVEYFIADGTLLGLIRNNNLIPHDTDIDFYLLGNSQEELIREIMLIRGYRIGRTMKRFSFLYQLTFYNCENLVIDYCFWKPSSKNAKEVIFRAPEIRKSRIQSFSHFSEHSLLSFQGVSFRTFSDPEAWLEMMYGPHWRIPESSKSDWRITARDLR